MFRWQEGIEYLKDQKGVTLHSTKEPQVKAESLEDSDGSTKPRATRPMELCVEIKQYIIITVTPTY